MSYLEELKRRGDLLRLCSLTPAERFLQEQEQMRLEREKMLQPPMTTVEWLLAPKWANYPEGLTRIHQPTTTEQCVLGLDPDDPRNFLEYYTCPLWEQQLMMDAYRKKRGLMI